MIQALCYNVIECFIYFFNCASYALYGRAANRSNCAEWGQRGNKRFHRRSHKGKCLRYVWSLLHEYSHRTHAGSKR